LPMEAWAFTEWTGPMKAYGRKGNMQLHLHTLSLKVHHTVLPTHIKEKEKGREHSIATQ